MPREAAAHQPLCADIDGFSLHAAVRIEAHDRRRLERLCRYITRPALSDERIQVNAAGQVALRLETPSRDGTTHRGLSPLEFMQRLAARVPRPRLHLIRYHGVLAPNATLRARVVAQGEQGPPARARAPPGQRPAPSARRPSRCGLWRNVGWARLLQRVFDIDLQRCPRCGAGYLQIIAAGLGLGGNDSYPYLFQPFGGCPDGTKVEDGHVPLQELPGIGFERAKRACLGR